MTSTVFVDQITPVPASWLNDVNNWTYFGQPPGQSLPGANQFLITNGSGIPTWSSGFPTGFIVPLSSGGTGANLTASNGGIFYSTASAGAILAGVARTGSIIQSTSGGAPTWSFAGYPATAGLAGTFIQAGGSGSFVSSTYDIPTTIGSSGTFFQSNGSHEINSAFTFPFSFAANQLLAVASTNTIAGLNSQNDAVLLTSPSGVPGWSAAGTNEILAASGSGIPGWQGSLPFTVGVTTGGTGQTSLTAYSVLCGGTTTTNPVQSVASVGSSGQVLTSNGASALPTWQTSSTSKLINGAFVTTGSVATGTGTFPFTNTAPTISGGTQFMTLSYTAASTANFLTIEVVLFGTTSTTSDVLCTALFGGNTLLGCSADGINAAGIMVGTTFRVKINPASTSAIAYTVRAGGTTGTTTFNGTAGGQEYGGFLASSITITETTV